MLQLILHLIGDYLLQSDWMALNKTKCSKAAAAHAVTYSLPFLLICPSAEAFLVICITHFFIDRFRLARYVVFAKSRLGPKRYWHKWEDCNGKTPNSIYRKVYTICSSRTIFPRFLVLKVLVEKRRGLHYFF